MVNAKLHIICGNCGCNNEFVFEVGAQGEDAKPYVYIKCKNCVTLHDLSDNAELEEE